MKRKTLLFSIFLGLSFDILFWKQNQGISFLIFITLLLICAFFLLHEFKTSQNKKGLVLLIPIAFFSIMSFIHVEPFVSFLNRWLSIALIGIWAVGYKSGLWMKFGLIDYLSKGLRLFWKMASLPWLRTNQLGIFTTEEKAKKGKVKPVIRGILIALPIIVVFALLFSSADLVFKESLDNFLDLFDIENLGEYLVRILLIFLTANAFLGLLTYAVVHSKEKKLIGEKKSFISPFIGTTEAVIVISSVLLLFATFTIVQFKYLFFNQTAIIELGFTYSEYARHGFGELVAVSILSLELILILNTVTKRESSQEERVFSLLLIGLVVGNLVVLTSSFLRLYLYESAYGFTRLRTYSFVFMIWLAILLNSVAILEWKKHSRMFTNIALVCILGFAATLNVLNVDAFIVKQNIKRGMQNKGLDSAYLASLSNDAVPALARAFNAKESPDSIKSDVGAALVCYQILNKDDISNQTWQSFTISRYRANQQMAALQDSLEKYVTVEEEWSTIIIDENGKETDCYSSFFFD